MANILVVDDSAVDCLLFRNYVERIPGFTAIEAKDGAHAMQQIESWGIDLIVTDLMMPNMDGLELLRLVRQKYPHIPVIIATGKGNESDAAKAMQRGAVGFVHKSQLGQKLVPLIRSTLAKAKAKAEADSA